ncbi:hypothetical protein MIR68_001894 [Amoeboaphelidium protococcarum]|nr:hypothetical protein MIR68_001894 [Amoeboaphelidium protococcarum]
METGGETEIKPVQEDSKINTSAVKEPVVKGHDKEKKSVHITEHMLSPEELSQKYYGVKFDAEKPTQSQGLSESLAEEKLAEHGPNMMSPPKSTPAYLKFLHCLFNQFNQLLIFAGILSFILYGIDPQNGISSLYVGAILILVALINSTIEFVQIQKSEAILKSFLGLVPRNCTTIRDGKLKSMGAESLVPGDVIHVRMGDKLPADIYIFWAAEFKVDNSSLTGEADPQERGPGNTQENPLEAHNLAFSGSLAVNGEAYGVVIRTGDFTVLGQIANMASGEKKRQSPMTVEIDNFVKMIALVAALTGVVFFIIGITTLGGQFPDSKQLIAFNFTFAIGVFISWVPEALPAIVTLLLSFAAQRMSKRNVLVKDLRGVETLGSITLLATDKTGTLTRNQMTVTNFWSSGEMYQVGKSEHKSSANLDGQPKSAGDENMPPVINGKDGEQAIGMLPLNRVPTVQMAPADDFKQFSLDVKSLNDLSMICYLCSKARFDATDVPLKQRSVIGDATESGLFLFAANTLPDSDTLAEQYPKVFEIPFNSTNKWHLSIHKMKHDNGDLTLLIKGAPERIFRLCSKIYSQSGDEKEITAEMKQDFQKSYEALAAKGHRVIGTAKFNLPAADYPADFTFRKDDQDKKELGEDKPGILGTYPKGGYTFCGLVSLEDPPKHGVREAIGKCRQAGVKVMMVTGDHPLTAEAIARKINLMLQETKEMVAKRTNRALSSIQEHEYNSIVIHGEKVDSLTEDDWERILNKDEIIFARTSPKHKLQIVKHCQERGHIVGVTGDGVNDSPALKKADLGISMNISGSDVSKEAAAMILLDDNFASTVHGISEGRLIFQNLKKCVRYTLCHILPEVIANLLFVVVPIPLPLYALQIILIDLGFEFFNGLSYAWEVPEHGEEGILMALPRKPVSLRSIDLLRRNNAYKAKQQNQVMQMVYGNNRPAAAAENSLVQDVDTSEMNWSTYLKYKTAATRVWFRSLFDKEGWQLYWEPRQEETLVDADILSYAYLEVGVLETIGCLLAFFHVFYVELGWTPAVVAQNAAQFSNTNALPQNLKEALFKAQSAYYFALLIMQIFNMFCCKVTTSYPFGWRVLKNKVTWISLAVSVAFSCFVIYPPFMHDVFQTNYLSPQYWLFPFVMGFVILMYVSARVAYRRRRMEENLNLMLPLDLHPTRFSTRSANQKQ